MGGRKERERGRERGSGRRRGREGEGGRERDRVERGTRNSCCLRGGGRGRGCTVCKHLSLQNTVESFASVLEQTSTWSNFTKEETSALATVVLESVKSTTLAAFLKPSANASQTVRTERLGNRARLHPGTDFEAGPWVMRFSVASLYPISPTVSNL